MSAQLFLRSAEPASLPRFCVCSFSNNGELVLPAVEEEVLPVDLADASDACDVSLLGMDQEERERERGTHATLLVRIPASPWSRARGRPDAAVHPHVLMFMARAELAFPVAAGRGGAGIVCHCGLFLVELARSVVSCLAEQEVEVGNDNTGVFRKLRNRRYRSCDIWEVGVIITPPTTNY